MAEKPKPKGWNAMSKAKQDAWKKANFSSSTKVTTAQLDKLRAAKTPTAAIAKYKNDPAMREALNRFYGKAKVTAAIGSSTSSSGPGTGGENSGSGSSSSSRYRGGPGAKPRLPRSGSGSGSGSGSSSSSSGGSSTKKKVNVGAAVALGTGLVPLAAKGAMLAKGSYMGAQKAVIRAKMDPKMVQKEFNKAHKTAMKTGFKGVGVPKGSFTLAPRKTARGRAALAAAVAEADKKSAARIAAAKTAAKTSKTTVKKTVTGAANTATKVVKTASKNKVVGAVVKAGKVAGLNTTPGRIITGVTALSMVKPLKPSKAKQGARKAPMGNPKKK